MKTTNNLNNTVPLSFGITALLIALFMITPLISSAAPKEDKEPKSNGKAYGHLVSPRFSQYFDDLINKHDWLPPGIKKIIDRQHHDDDDDDNVLPELTNTDKDISTSTANLTFTFDEEVRVKLYLSTTSGFAKGDAGVKLISQTNYDDTHSFMLDDLEADTTYYFKIVYQDEAGGKVTSDEMNLTTDEIVATDIIAPIISNIASSTGTTSITASWTTNEPATSAIYTSLVSGFNLNDIGVIKTENLVLKTLHNLLVTGLSASTTYYHRIVVEDAAGNETISNEFNLGTD